MRRTHQARRSRRGAVIVWLVFALAVLLAALAVAVNQARLWTARAELQVAADAAALAGAGTLVDDALIRGDPGLLPGLLQNAADAAAGYARANPVLGRPFVLLPNPTNLPDGDILFGTVDTPRSRHLTPAVDVQDPDNGGLALVNTVRVAARLTRTRGTAPGLPFAQFMGLGSADVQAEAAATLDRDVIGFQPSGAQPLLLAPLALLADPAAQDARSWQYQVEAGNGPDDVRFDPVGQTFVAGADGIHEMDAVLALDPGQAGAANVSLLLIGVANASDAARQLLAGMTADQIASLGGPFVLAAADNRLTVPGTVLGPAVGSNDLGALEQALTQLQQEAAPRIWPLSSGLDAGGRPVLCGFVAARVVAVTPAAAGQPLRFTLQATVISSARAVTNAAQRGAGGIALVNPYICKVRLVE